MYEIEGGVRSRRGRDGKKRGSGKLRIGKRDVRKTRET